jgi:hypothetical protein
VLAVPRAEMRVGWLGRGRVAPAVVRRWVVWLLLPINLMKAISCKDMSPRCIFHFTIGAPPYLMCIALLPCTGGVHPGHRGAGCATAGGYGNAVYPLLRQIQRKVIYA